MPPRNKPKAIPKKPEIVPRKINTNCRTERALEMEGEGAANAPRAEIETIMINRGLAILALTADWPRIRPPTIPKVEPIGSGTRIEASFMSSKARTIIISSRTVGKGICFRLASIARSKSVGMLS